MYRTFANLVESRIKYFRDAGVTGEQIGSILDAGEIYVQKEAGGETDQVVREEAKAALKRARMTVRAAFGGCGTEKGGSDDGRKGSGGLSEGV